jgi:hypothetical protein
LNYSDTAEKRRAALPKAENKIKKSLHRREAFLINNLDGINHCERNLSDGSASAELIEKAKARGCLSRLNLKLCRGRRDLHLQIWVSGWQPADDLFEFFVSIYLWNIARFLLLLS